MNDIIIRLAPIIAEIIVQGIKEGVFETDFPVESSEILLAAAHCLFDNNLLNFDEEAKSKRALAIVFAAEKLLNAKAGSLSNIVTMIG